MNTIKSIGESEWLMQMEGVKWPFNEEEYEGNGMRINSTNTTFMSSNNR